MAYISDIYKQVYNKTAILICPVKVLLKERLLPSLSLLRKIKSGYLSFVKVLKDESKISYDMVIIFDEMYLQKCEEYIGKLVGSNKNEELYKGVVWSMIVVYKKRSLCC